MGGSTAAINVALAQVLIPLIDVIQSCMSRGAGWSLQLQVVLNYDMCCCAVNPDV